MTSANHMGARMGAILAQHDTPGPEYALVECAAPQGCRRSARIEWSAGRTDDDLAEEFAKQGWTVGPTRCPDHTNPPEPEGESR